MLFICHPKFCISIVFSSSWGHFNSQEKLKVILMQKFLGDKQRAWWYVMVFSGVVSWLKQYCLLEAGALYHSKPKNVSLGFVKCLADPTSTLESALMSNWRGCLVHFIHFAISVVRVFYSLCNLTSATIFFARQLKASCLTDVRRKHFIKRYKNQQLPWKPV